VGGCMSWAYSCMWRTGVEIDLFRFALLSSRFLVVPFCLFGVCGCGWEFVGVGR
jgi:hypothetical protein